MKLGKWLPAAESVVALMSVCCRLDVAESVVALMLLMMMMLLVRMVNW